MHITGQASGGAHLAHARRKVRSNAEVEPGAVRGTEVRDWHLASESQLSPIPTHEATSGARGDIRRYGVLETGHIHTGRAHGHGTHTQTYNYRHAARGGPVIAVPSTSDERDSAERGTGRGRRPSSAARGEGEDVGEPSTNCNRRRGSSWRATSEAHGFRLA